MRILIVQKVKALVGSEKYFLELLPALEKHGHKTVFACVYLTRDKAKTLPFINAMKRLNLAIHSLEVTSDKSILKCLAFIAKIYKKGAFDLVHAHLIHADLWCALLKKTNRIKVPLVSTKHGYDEAYISKHGFSAEKLTKNRYYRLCKFSEKYINRSFAVSEGLRQLFINAGFSTADKIETIHHGFDLPEIDRTPNANFRFAQQQLVVLGRIIPFKGHQLLFNALPQVKAEFPDFKLIILGHGDADLIQQLEQFCTVNGLNENVVFKGYQNNIYDYLANSDIMVVPSIAEGFGLIFLEALNAKIPIIGFDVPATNEVLLHQKTGILVPPYNTDHLAQSIIELLKNEQLRANYADAGYARLHNYFSLDRMITATLAFYQRALLDFSNKGKAE